MSADSKTKSILDKKKPTASDDLGMTPAKMPSAKKSSQNALAMVDGSAKKPVAKAASDLGMTPAQPKRPAFNPTPMKDRNMKMNSSLHGHNPLKSRKPATSPPAGDSGLPPGYGREAYIEEQIGLSGARKMDPSTKGAVFQEGPGKGMTRGVFTEHLKKQYDAMDDAGRAGYIKQMQDREKRAEYYANKGMKEGEDSGESPEVMGEADHEDFEFALNTHQQPLKKGAAANLGFNNGPRATAMMG